MIAPDARLADLSVRSRFQGVRQVEQGQALNGEASEETWVGGASQVHLGDSFRRAIMLTACGHGSFTQQTAELLKRLHRALLNQGQPMQLTYLTVFLADAAQRTAFSEAMRRSFPGQAPIITPVYQPPCGGAALAVEAWAFGGPGVKIEHHGEHSLSVEYDGMRWIYCGGVVQEGVVDGVFDQTALALRRVKAELGRAGAQFQEVLRTWFYLGAITGPDSDSERYKEMNRARTDLYQEVQFCRTLSVVGHSSTLFPASTGIGMEGRDLVIGCLALKTERKDVRVAALENPLQVPAYTYHPKYSPKSPKFSRAMALVTGDYVTTWISGTASIVNSESCFPGDIEAQTDQTLDNIERLIGDRNLAAHGLSGAGATLKDLAKARVYVKRAEDYPRCRAICEQRLGCVPVIYALADVCRPELLVEIEGVAFSHYAS